jgi:hypothetical protein
VIAAPPSLIGAVNEMDAEVDPVTVALPIVGADGTEGVKVAADNEDSDAIEDPTEFVAITRNL